MTHEHTEMDFSSGINIIVGETGSGKSNVIRALVWLLYNHPMGNEFIRKGKKEAKVTAELSNGTKIIRCKNITSKNYYKIIDENGEETTFNNFGYDFPQEISDVTQIQPVRIDDNSSPIFLNLCAQLEQPFFVSDDTLSAAERAKWISTLMQIGRIDNLIDSFHGDIIEINRYKLKSYETALEETKKELELYNNLGASISRMEDLKKKYDILQEKQCRLNALKKLKEEYSKYKKEVGLYRDEIREVENKLQYEKKINGLENSKNIITKLINLRAKYNFNKNNIEECQRIIKNNNKIEDLDIQNLSDKLIK